MKGYSYEDIKKGLQLFCQMKVIWSNYELYKTFLRTKGTSYE